MLADEALTRGDPNQVVFFALPRQHRAGRADELSMGLSQAIIMEIEEAVATAYARGVASWCKVEHPADAFRARMLSLEVRPGDLDANGADLYLASACLAADPAALLAFERSLLHTLSPTIGPLVLGADEMDELRQRLRLKLLVGPDPRLGRYRGQGPLGSWVRMCALREAVDLIRQTRLSLASDGAHVLETLVCQDASPELLAAKAQHGTVFRSALDECFTELPLRDKTLLRMHLVDGTNIDQIGRVFRVHRATVARWVTEVRAQVLERLCAKLSVRLGASGSELRSLIRLMAKDLQVSLVRVLGPSAEGTDR